MANSFRDFGVGNRTFRHEAPTALNLRSEQSGDALGDSTVRGPMPALIGANFGDPVDGLPPGGATRLQGMRERAADLGVLARNSFEIEQDLRTETGQIENRIKNLTAPRGDGGHGLGDDDPRVRAEQKNLDLKTAELARRRELSEVRGHEQQVLLRLIGNCETWLRGGGRPGGTRIVAFDGELPSPKAGTDLPAAIEDRRRRLRELAADRHRVESAPFPSAGAKAKGRNQIAALGELGRLDVTALLEHGANEFGWPLKMHQITIHNSTEPLIGFIELVDFEAVLAQLVPDLLLKSLDRELNEAADDASALSDVQRQKALAVIDGDILATERVETELVWLAREKGMAVHHREDVHPLALLNLALVVAREGSLPETDGGHTTRHVGAPR
jgi:hypothetical protein